MCIAIMKPEGEILSEQVLRNCMHNNGDGAGFSIIEKDDNGKDEINIYKGYFEFKDFWEAWQPNEDKQAILHFRIATHRMVNGANCHPFRINENLVLAHNGRISNLPDDDEWSDTGVFCDKIIKPFAKMHPDFWLNDKFKWFMENSIGVGNKLIMMDVQGRYMIFNENLGKWDGKTWFSNSTYNYGTKNWRNDPDEEYYHNYRGSHDPHINEMHQNDEDVIDVTAEITKINEVESGSTNTASPSKELIEIENEFTTLDLEEIDRRLEQAQAAV